MAASTTVTFQSLSDTVVVNGPRGDQPLDNTSKFVMGMTQGGTRYVYKKSDATNKIWSLPFDMISNTQKEDLQAFFDSASVLGPSNTFQYTHTDGTSYTVRFAQTSLAWRRSLPNMWGLTLQLEMTSADVVT